MNKRFEYHETRLATTDEKGRRITLYPEDISGKWKSRRRLLYGILIAFYLILPWIYIDGKQLVLLNIPKREFTFFGMTFLGHDGPLIVFILLALGFLLAFVTSIWGRVWCGYACPQTVFIDSIFRVIERIVEGSARQRRKLDESSFTLKKGVKKSLKWLLFLIVSLHIVHSFLGYFVGTRSLVEISLQSPFENLQLFVIMLVLTFLVLFDFGHFREQFCTIACPYGRIQSVLMDESTKVVGYDYNRGEPRRGSLSTEEDRKVAQKEGDCINCYQCVKSCPTGIDIRRGTQQLECINCTMCIDACDTIMQKLNKETGLIRYTSENELEKKTARKSPRVTIYFLGLVISVSALVFSVRKRLDVSSNFLRVRGEPYTIVENDKFDYLNRYKVRLHYYGGEDLFIDFKVPASLSEQVEVVAATLPVKIMANNEVFLFIKFKKSVLKEGSAQIELHEIILNDQKIVDTKVKRVRLVGPY